MAIHSDSDSTLHILVPLFYKTVLVYIYRYCFALVTVLVHVAITNTLQHVF